MILTKTWTSICQSLLSNVLTVLGPLSKRRKNQDPSLLNLYATMTGKMLIVNKKRLKGKGISVTESLTKFRMQKRLEARETHGFSNTWTIDGRIMYKGENNKPVIYYG